MSKVVDIKVELSGFPVNIGGIEFFFSTAEGHIIQFMDMVENQDEWQAKIEKLHKESGLAKANSVASLTKAFDKEKEAVSIVFDTIFNPGDFERLYVKFPDIQAILSIMNETVDVINVKIDEWSEGKKKETDKKVAQALINKKKKKAK